MKDINTSTDRFLEKVGDRIVVILLLRLDTGLCRYRCYFADGSFLDYDGYEKLPEPLKTWLSARNAYDYVIPSCMVVSGVRVIGNG